MIFKNCILKNKILYLFSFLVLLTSFTTREPHYCKILDRITRNYRKEFTNPRGLMLTGYGGAMMHDIKEVELNFLSFDKLNVDAARILYVEMMEEFLCRINCHEKIRPYLHNFPFEESNIKLSIGFENSNRKITRDGHVALMGIAKNHILYFAAYDPVEEKFYDLSEENYEEARRIVKGH